jgi:hypothetical protein
MKARPALFWLAFFLLGPFLCATWAVAGEPEGKWPGVDESVVEKVAKEHGRAARDPLINTDQGDLLLFIFLLAGAVGGFVAGYYWRVLISPKDLKLPEEPQRLH